MDNYIVLARGRYKTFSERSEALKYASKLEMVGSKVSIYGVTSLNNEVMVLIYKTEEN